MWDKLTIVNGFLGPFLEQNDLTRKQSAFLPVQAITRQHSEQEDVLPGSIQTIAMGETREYETLKEEFALINHNNPFYKIDKVLLH